MDIFNRTPLQQAITFSISWALIGASFCFVLLLLWQAAHFPETINLTRVQIGPFALMQIEKIPISSNQFNLSFQWLSGLIWYYCSWIGITLLIGLRKYANMTTITAK